MVPDRIERDIEIAVPVAHVWALVTQPEHLGTWLGDAGATVDLRPGGAITLSWRDYGTLRAVIDQVEPMHVFSFRCARLKDTDPVAGNSTLVEFTLTASGSGTHLRVVETGFNALDGDDADRIAAREENVGGWTSDLEDLRRYAVETHVAA